MISKIEKRKNFIITALYFLLIVGIVYLFFKYAIFIVMPFLIGFAIAAVVSRSVRWLSGRFGLKKRPVGVMILLIFYGTVGMLLTVLTVRTVVMLGDFLGNLPTIYSDKVEPLLEGIFLKINDFLNSIDGKFGIFSDDVSGFFETIKSSLGKTVSDVSVMALTRLSAFAAEIPQFLLELLFVVISSFLFTLDFEKILSFLKRKLPSKAVDFMTDIRSRLFKTTGRYLKSYSIIMLITFGELALGFVIIGVGHPFAVALAIAFFDILPVLGTGGILLPWAALTAAGGEVGHAIGLVVIWAVISVVRNIIEPKIVGRQVGLPPLATLIAMFVGTRLFGIVGLFLFPVILSVAVSALRDRQPPQASAGDSPSAGNSPSAGSSDSSG